MALCSYKINAFAVIHVNFKIKTMDFNNANCVVCLLYVYDVEVDCYNKRKAKMA